MKRWFSVFLYLIAPLWTAPTPLLVLKAGRSGSSWFTYLLNRLDGVHVTEELFGRKNQKFRKRAKKINTTAYAAESFQHPMVGYPKGEDLTQRNRTFAIIGSTFNPKETYVRPDVLAKMVPNLQVVVYLRSNVVKHVISHIRGFALSRKCGSLVVKGTCRLEGKTLVKLEEFKDLLFWVIAQDQYIWEFARDLTNYLGRDFRVIWYEDIIGLGDEIEKLIEWLGFDINDFGLTNEINTRCSVNCTKNTSDDLRDMIKNYKDVEGLIKSKYNCLLSQLYETRPGKVQPSVDKICGDLFTTAVSAIIEETFKKQLDL